MDGKISGVAFMDGNADGLMGADETARYAGTERDAAQSVRRGGRQRRRAQDGRYANLRRFPAAYIPCSLTRAAAWVFSDGGALYSEHVQSAVRDTHYRLSDALVIDGDHATYIVNVGCIYAGEVYGAVLERLEDGKTVGFWRPEP